MKKYQTKCNDCKTIFFLDDADWCIHKKTLGIGSKECPECHKCICHGETKDAIEARFASNIEKGKFIPADDNPFDWSHMCKTVKVIDVPDGEYVNTIPELKWEQGKEMWKFLLKGTIEDLLKNPLPGMGIENMTRQQRIEKFIKEARELIPKTEGKIEKEKLEMMLDCCLNMHKEEFGGFVN